MEEGRKRAFRILSAQAAMYAWYDVLTTSIFLASAYDGGWPPVLICLTIVYSLCVHVSLLIIDVCRPTHYT